MLQNQILGKIPKIREEHANSFNYDLDAKNFAWQPLPKILLKSATVRSENWGFM